MKLLANDVDLESVQAAARRLQDFGLAWDGRRLLGTAAAHSSDRRTTTALLHAARSLQDPAADAPATAGDGADAGNDAATASTGRRSATVLSPREREVAELLLKQHTYREIGKQLYISAKTVEHHVARIKQRVGTSEGADLLAQLRVIVDAHHGV